jgi:hypothetical protein
VEGCYAVKARDTLRSDSKSGSFPEDFWGHGVHQSFLDVVQNGMSF